MRRIFHRQIHSQSNGNEKHLTLKLSLPQLNPMSVFTPFYIESYSPQRDRYKNTDIGAP